MTHKKFTEKEIINSKSWVLLHKHKSFCNYLIAYYVISRLKDDNDIPTEILKAVYPHEINVFVKDLLNEDFDTAKKILKRIKSIYKECNITARTHLCYLLGRIKFKGLHDEAKEFLNNIIIEETNDNDDYDISPESKKQREKFLLLRTISISLVFLGIKKASNEYINKLLRDPCLNNLNRGFHLEYYGDIKFIPDQDALIHEDNLVSFPNTFKKLIDQINKNIKSMNIDDPLFEINIFTLCSLAQHRHIFNKLPEYKTKEIIELTDNILQNKIDINAELRDYILLVNKNLKKDNYDPLAILDKLYESKSVLRTGWIRAKVERPESIADHMYSSMWIASVCLPEKIPDELKYDKQRIKDMLFIHDIGELYLGDKTPGEITDDFRNKEDMWVKHILMHDTFSDYNAFPCIQNLSKYREIWNEWYNGSTINARIAKDIDVIDRLYQYNMYKSRGHMFCNDDIKNWADDKYNIKTVIGKKILRYLIEEHFEGRL
jgi:5'-deoxynucleotidase YfbR-like HD superfamily hydrolase